LNRFPLRSFLTLLATIALGPVQAQTLALAPLASTGAMPPGPWRVVGLPSQKMPLTQFSLVDLEGRRALRIEANDSYGNLVHPLSATPSSLQLAWQWRLDQPVAGADLRTKAGDDTALKVCVFFDLALEKIPFGERQLMRLARARSGEHLPGATLCYVWDSQLPVDTTLPNAYTRRMRYLVLQSGPAKLGQWVAERRDVLADFAKAFGPESTPTPPVIGIAIGADTDNTHSRSLGFVADLVIVP
jgi:hypothetical protein